MLIISFFLYSEYDALTDLQIHKPKLNTIMEKLDEIPFTPEELIFLDEYLEVTKPIAITVDILQGNSASLGTVLPAIAKLKKHYERIIEVNNLRFCLPMAKYILWDLNRRTSHLFEDRDYILGMYT